MAFDLNDEELKATRDSNGANICVGDYVRDKWGKIDKVINDDYYMSLYIECHKGLVEIENIVKHSKDIKKLIKIGDILEFNNEKYEVIYDESYEKLGVLIPNRNHLAIKHMALEYIFSEYKDVKIITKEQFNSIAYRLEE